MPHSFFSNFTNLYPIQKTLRRELKPLNEHFQHDPALLELRNDDLIARDQKREEDYQAINPLLDQLHEKFIVQSLEKVKGENWSDFVTFFLAYQQHKKQKADLSEKELRSLEDEFKSRTAELRKAIANAYSITANERILSPDYQDAKGDPLLKQKGYKILTEQGILSVLEKIHAQDEEKVALIKRFGNFFTYFSGFNQNRENYYSMEEKSTAVAYRVVNQNLLNFANNTQLKEKLSVLELSEQEKAIFDPENYGNYLSQTGIDEYNRQLASIRSKSNLYQQQQKIKLPQPKDLYKQIGAEQESKIPFDLIETDQELQKTVQLVLTETDQRVKKIAAFFAMLKQEDLDLSQIFLSKSAFNQLSNRYFANWHLLLEKGVEHKLFAYKKNDEEKFKLPAYISLAQLKLLLESLPTTKAEGEESIGLFKQHLEKKQKV